MMHLILVGSFILILSTKSLAKICVIEEMVTINHSKCADTTSCANNDIERYKRSNKNAENIVFLKPGSPSLSHYGSIEANNEPSNYAKFLYRKSMFVAEVTGHYCDKDDVYRSFDGTCNNLDNPSWGCTNSEMIRLLPPRYAFNGQIAKSSNGSELPLARILSMKLFTDHNVPSPNQTLAVMQWGQLIAHDTGRSPSYYDKPVDCCASTSRECAPIYIPPDDPFYGQFNVTCMNLVRSRYTYKTINCTSLPYQISAVSHPIDLSHLYGSTVDIARTLRQFEGGLLSVHLTENGRTFPELSNNPQSDCNSLDQNYTCFYSSDDRINQNTQLTCLQTVLLREHNRIASTLATMNPNWNDELLFQESRRILIAVFQHISYNEWLPFILTEEYRKKHHLIPLKEGYTQYNENINLGTINSFMAGAFRVLHSQIQGYITMYNATRCPFRTLHLSDWMNRPEIIMQKSNFDSLLIGLTVEFDQQVDRYFTKQITEMLFHGSFSYGEDLESFDIQRGRDHGLPSYNDMRELCKMSRLQNFSDLIGDIDEKLVNVIADLYETVDDIDYFVGATLEKNHNTFMCIVGEQLVRKKFGDRFWYEHGGLKHSFSSDQLVEIRKASFSRLLCDNGDNISSIQPNGFLPYTYPGNAVKSCSDILAMDLAKWKETNQTDIY